MTASLHDVRALVTIVDRSPWRELYVRADGWTVFFAKPGGGPNPMQQHAPAAALATAIAITAPHLGLFTASLPVDSIVDADTVVGMIDVLGSFSEITTDIGGIIEAVPVASGMLVEYGAPLVLIRPL